MAEKAFRRAACFTDLHIGNKSNSSVFNQDCRDYIDWFLDTAADFGAETCIFLGDLFHNRSTLNVSSLNVGLDVFEKVAGAFDHSYWIVGNHDMYYRDRRDVNSVEIGRNISNVTVVQSITEVGDTAFVPWLVGDEWKSVKKLKSRYIFGHFALPNFLMNQMIEMPDQGADLRATDFTDRVEYVFSGHFHMRQAKGKVIYIGNAFPHRFDDVGDDDRGCMLLQHGAEPSFVNWPEAPRYRRFSLSGLSDRLGELNGKTYLQLSLDIEVNFEETAKIKEYLLENGAREVDLRPIIEEFETEYVGDLQFQSVDQIVTEGLYSIESATIDPDYLVQIYQHL